MLAWLCFLFAFFVGGAGLLTEGELVAGGFMLVLGTASLIALVRQLRGRRVTSGSRLLLVGAVLPLWALVGAVAWDWTGTDFIVVAVLAALAVIWSSKGARSSSRGAPSST
jgi:hypothetical protein